MQRRWQIHPAITDDQRQAFADLPTMLVQLLINRGCTSMEDAEVLLHPDFATHVHDPLQFSGMEKAVERICCALSAHEKIRVFGDYDVDGISAVAVFLSLFRALNVTTADSYIPDRYAEGYGLNKGAVDAFAKDGVTLLITCDCGTSNAVEIARARKKGMDVIIVDHHKKAETVPEAFAILNPAFDDEPYPYHKLCSTAVAYKVAAAVLRKLQYGKGMLDTPLPDGWEKWLLDLVALATVADLMPLTGENRALVKYGLVVLKQTRRPGLAAMFASMTGDRQRITTATIGYQIAPRLNAAGRIKHATAALGLLMTDDAAEARRLAAELDQTNSERQGLTERLFTEALDQVPKDPLPTLLAVVGNDWPSGVVGLVAGRLKERYHRPSLAIGLAGGKLTGSGRSVTGFDITRALAEANKYLAHYGGHPLACGFTLSSVNTLEPFLAAMQRIAERELAGRDLSPVLLIDAQTTFAVADGKLVETAQRLEPFGMANGEPVFSTRDCTIRALERVGMDGKHLRLLLDDGSASRQAIGFGMGERAQAFAVGDRVVVAYHLSFNDWNGSRQLQLRLVDMVHADHVRSE